MADTMPRIIPMKMADSDTVRQWKLTKEWHYKLDTIHIVIPKGFIFDGASIPRAFTAVYSPTGYLFLAALVHDYCYRHGHYLEVFSIDGLDSKPFKMLVDRRHSDIMFKKIAVAEYPNHKIKSWVAYKALRVGGWVAWDEHQKNHHLLDIEQ